MTIKYYRKGQKVRVTCEFEVWNAETQTWVLTDPTTVTCKVMDPSRNVTASLYGTDADPVRESTGVYHVDVILDEKEEWNVRFEGTGTCTAVEELTFGANTVFP